MNAGMFKLRLLASVTVPQSISNRQCNTCNGNTANLSNFRGLCACLFLRHAQGLLTGLRGLSLRERQLTGLRSLSLRERQLTGLRSLTLRECLLTGFESLGLGKCRGTVVCFLASGICRQFQAMCTGICLCCFGRQLFRLDLRSRKSTKVQIGISISFVSYIRLSQFFQEESLATSPPNYGFVTPNSTEANLRALLRTCHGTLVTITPPT